MAWATAPHDEDLWVAWTPRQDHALIEGVRTHGASSGAYVSVGSGQTGVHVCARESSVSSCCFMLLHLYTRWQTIREAHPILPSALVRLKDRWKLFCREAREPSAPVPS